MYSFRVLVILLLFSLQSSFCEAETGIVKKIVDGDTIWVELNGKVLRTRLLCIDTLEKIPNEKLTRDEKRLREKKDMMIKGGQAASAYLKSILHYGDTVRIETGGEKYDQYGRLLAYVYTKKGIDVNLTLVREGYAGVLCYSPNDSRTPQFLASLDEARSHKRGLWGKGYTLSERWVH